MIPVDDACGQPPGSELVQQGMQDLRTGRVTCEALLLSRFASRLASCGYPLPVPPLPDAEIRMYELLGETEGTAAHSAYNALTRRLISFMSAAGKARS